MQWYEELFQNYGRKYDFEPFAQGTQGEVAFIEQEIGFDTSKRILDIGCGTGRHAIELAKRGYRVVGLDLSNSMLAQARKNAAEAKVAVEFLQKDARDFSFEAGFDLAIMICEGAFPLMETDEMNFRILQNAKSALNPGGKLIFTTLNGLFPLFHPDDFPDFDLMTFRNHSKFEGIDDAGKSLSLEMNERFYMPAEISWLMASLDFQECEIFGAKLGAFSRTDVLGIEDREMLVIAQL